MNRFLLSLCGIAAAFALTTLSATAQNAPMRIGIVDVEKIVQQMPEFKGVEARLQTARKGYEDTLRAIQANFQAKAENYQKQQALLSPEARQKEENDLNGLREQFMAYQQERFGPQGTLAQLQEQLLAPIRERVRSVIERVAKEEKIAAVMDRGLLVYSDPKLDITFKVLDYLNRGSN